MGDDLVSIQAIGAIRTAFREETAAAQADVREAAQLQEIIGALSARLYATSPHHDAV